MFNLGKVVYTRGVASEIEKQSLSEFDIMKVICRHNSGDWGDLCEEDKAINNDALLNNDRLLSSYKIKGIKLYVITEWDRSSTTILLPEEY